MKIELKWLLCGLMSVSMMIGCDGDKKSDNEDTESTADTDADTDTDTDSDADTDTDSSTDTEEPIDTDTEVDNGLPEGYVAISVPLAPWVNNTDTPLGIQGSWYNYLDGQGSSITPQQLFFETPGKLCVEGEGAQVIDQAYGVYWGAGFGLDLCNTGNDGVPPNTKFTLSTCPLPDATDLDKRIVGVSFLISGNLPDMFLRVQYGEQDEGVAREKAAYTEVRAEGRVVSMFKDAYVAYDMTQPELNVANIVSVQFQVPTNADGTMPFDFCISDLVLLTVETWDTDEDSDTVDSDTLDTDTADTDTVDTDTADTDTVDSDTVDSDSVTD